MLATLLIAVAACSQGAEPESPPEAPPAGPGDQPALSADETALLLSHPATAEAGVWSVLANLNVGVYTGDAVPLLTGAEQSDDDFYLYDFEIPMLAGMASGDRRSIADLALFITTALDDFEITGEELTDLFTEIFLEVPDHFIAGLFAASPPESGWEVTPFEEWVLLMSLLPVEPDVGLEAMAFASGATPMVGSPMAESHCSVAGGGASGHDIAGAYLGTVVDELSDAALEVLAESSSRTVRNLARFRIALGRAASVVAKPLDLTRVAIILDNLDLTVNADPWSTRRFHDRRGETEESTRVTVTANVTFKGYGPDVINCGALAGLAFPPPGPIEGAMVRFRLDGVLASHGYLKVPVTVPGQSPPPHTHMQADASGQVTLWYETTPLRPVEAQFLSDDHLKRALGVVSAEFTVLGAMGEWFNVFASFEILAQLLGDMTRTAHIDVTWLEGGGTTAEGHVVTVMDEAGNLFGMEVVLYACDGPTGTWQGEVIVFDPEDGWTLGHTEVTFAFPEDTPQVTVPWTIAADGITVDASFLVEIVGHGDQAVMVLISSGQLVAPDPFGTWQVEGTIRAPIMAGDDPRCPKGE